MWWIGDIDHEKPPPPSKKFWACNECGKPFIPWYDPSMPTGEQLRHTPLACSEQKFPHATNTGHKEGKIALMCSEECYVVHVARCVGES